jgi:hypothetical protein
MRPESKIAELLLAKVTYARHTSEENYSSDLKMRMTTFILSLLTSLLNNETVITVFPKTVGQYNFGYKKKLTRQYRRTQVNICKAGVINSKRVFEITEFKDFVH